MNTLYKPKRSSVKEPSLWEMIKSIPIVNTVINSKELTLITFFLFLFFILAAKLFWLQIVKHDEYDMQLSRLHYKESSLDPERGNIYALDKGGHEVQLTENITLYDLALDPKDLTEFPAENLAKGLPS
jgi:cell division protein FtsI/penicillin-binding protein 2